MEGKTWDMSMVRQCHRLSVRCRERTSPCTIPTPLPAGAGAVAAPSHAKDQHIWGSQPCIHCNGPHPEFSRARHSRADRALCPQVEQGGCHGDRGGLRMPPDIGFKPGDTDTPLLITDLQQLQGKEGRRVRNQRWL